MLEYLITSQTKRQLLRLFFTNPERAFFLREIARFLGSPLSGVRKELLQLEKAGIIISQREGGRLYFKLKKDFAFFEELKRIILGTVGLGDVLKRKLQSPRSIKLAFIYGSVARGEETPQSDIDLFIVGNITEKELHRIITRAENEISREINYTLMTPKEFQERIKSDDPFLKRLFREEKIFLKGKVENEP